MRSRRIVLSKNRRGHFRESDLLGRAFTYRSSSITAPDGVVPRLLGMLVEIGAHPLLKIGGYVDRLGVQPRQFGFERLPRHRARA